MDTTSGYGRIALDFTTTLRGVTDEQWALPTPCTDWNVRELVTHVIATHRRILAMVDPTTPSPDDVGDDVTAEWFDVSSRLDGALGNAAMASTEVTTRGGPQPWSSVVDGLLSVDTLCHTWDLAHATGQDETLDPRAVAHAHAMLEPMDAAIRVPGGFAPALAAPEDADAQTRFLCFTGRRVI